MAVSLMSQIQCVKFKVKRRKKVFPYLIKNGKLTQEDGDES